ncbi:hypothetical protein [Streptomyces fradiae]|uniref:hypothetical protein n=1 Tax=Streptomyces fradiae TaxID=1906 RepID=UPI002943186D|nr:hypothetical protein [Streptomyces fradiae]WOI61737.1 hypothetical protein RYQ63_18565 [Streptomyces fradiae]
MAAWTRAVAAAGALAVVLTAAGCDGGSSKADGKGGGSSASGSASGSGGGSGGEDEKTTYRLGEESPEVESDMQASKDARYTLTPLRVKTGTKADMDGSGLKKDDKDGPKVPVYVWAKVTHKSGTPMEVGDMDGDLAVRTDKGTRTRALIVLLGEAKWPDCPAPDTEKKLAPGQSAEICKAFLVPEGEKAAAVEVTRGFYKKPLEWPAAG